MQENSGFVSGKSPKKEGGLFCVEKKLTVPTDTVPKFNDVQLGKQAEKQIRFLKAIYPFLEDEENWNEGAIELRPLKRDASLKKDFIRSYNAWHLQEKDAEALKKFLGLVNGKGYCLYFSGFAFDYNKVVLKSDGKPYRKGKINNENALFTSILPMDFDGMSYEDFLKEKQRLLDLGIETIDVFSGHGFQSIILLSHKVLDKDIYKKFAKLLISKGFKVDDVLVDPARILRMPYSFNCKALDEKNKYYDPVSPEIIPTTDVGWTEKRYHVIDVFEKINDLPDVVAPITPLTEIEIKSIITAPITRSDKKKKDIEIAEVKKIHIQNLKTVYPMLHFDRLPEPVQKMLAGSQEGLRNDVVLFLIPFLRNSLGLSLQTIKHVMVLWGDRCSPRLDEEFIKKEVDRIYSYGLKGKHGKYTEKLLKAYGYLQFDSYKRDNKIIIPNTIFEDFDVLSDGAVRIYLAIKLAEKMDGVKEFTKKDIQQYADIVERTVERNVKDLVAMGYVCKRRTNRRIGEEYVYYLNPYFSSTEGFTILENAVVKLMLKMLTDGEMKLYSYLCRMISNEGDDCWASQKYLARRIGKKGHNAISMMTDSLNKKGFINKQTTQENGVMHSTYNLNY